MSRPPCSVCYEANWSLGVNILGDIAKLAELHRTEEVLLKTTDGILQTGHTHENGQLKNDDNSKQAF